MSTVAGSLQVDGPIAMVVVPAQAGMTTTYGVAPAQAGMTTTYGVAPA